MFALLFCLSVHMVLYFCTIKNHENTKVDEKETPEKMPTILMYGSF